MKKRKLLGRKGIEVLKRMIRKKVTIVMKMQVKKIRKKLAVVLVAGAVVAVSVYTYPLAKAVFQRENAVHINAETIENSTMIVGTHLIHISALNDELYDMAAKSAERSGQQEIYYK